MQMQIMIVRTQKASQVLKKVISNKYDNIIIHLSVSNIL